MHIMEKREDGVFIKHQEIQRAREIVGYIGIGAIVMEVVRFLVWRSAVKRQ